MEKLYDVLWIEDDAEGCKSFIKLCTEKGIDLRICPTREEGIKVFENEKTKWDAVILDAKCPNKANSIADVDGFMDVVRVIGNNVPIFVYTGEPEIIADDTFTKMCGATQVFEKGRATGALIAAIVENTSDRIKVKRKYKKVFEVVDRCFRENAEKVREILLKALLHVENQDVIVGSDYNELRNILEYLCTAMNSFGLIPDEYMIGKNGRMSLTDCCKYISGQKNKDGKIDCREELFPSSMGGLFKFLCYKFNDCCHAGGNPMQFLYYGCCLQMCEIIIMLDHILCNHPNKVENILLAIYTEYEGEEVVPEKDENNHWHYKECLVPIQELRTNVVRYRLRDVRRNTGYTKNKYKYFAKFEPIESK